MNFFDRYGMTFRSQKVVGKFDSHKLQLTVIVSTRPCHLESLVTPLNTVLLWISISEVAGFSTPDIGCCSTRHAGRVEASISVGTRFMIVANVGSAGQRWPSDKAPIRFPPRRPA